MTQAEKITCLAVNPSEADQGAEWHFAIYQFW